MISKEKYKLAITHVFAGTILVFLGVTALLVFLNIKTRQELASYVEKYERRDRYLMEISEPKKTNPDDWKSELQIFQEEVLPSNDELNRYLDSNTPKMVKNLAFKGYLIIMDDEYILVKDDYFYPIEKSNLTCSFLKGQLINLWDEQSKVNRERLVLSENCPQELIRIFDYSNGTNIPFTDYSNLIGQKRELYPNYTRVFFEEVINKNGSTTGCISITPPGIANNRDQLLVSSNEFGECNADGFFYAQSHFSMIDGSLQEFNVIEY